MGKGKGVGALMLAVVFVSISAWAAPSLYRFPADGIEIKFPTSPTETHLNSGLFGYVNAYQSLTADGTKTYTVFVNHGTGRVFSDSSIDAYLKGLVTGLTTGTNNSSKVSMERENFKGYPGIRYEITETTDGLPTVTKGRAIIVDGDHIRLGMFYVDTPENRNVSDDSFFESFRLLPVDGELSSKAHTDSVGTFYPPAGWTQSKSETPPQITAIYSNKSGHSITVIDSQAPSYTCRSYEAEILGTGLTPERGLVLAEQTTFTSYKTTIFNKEAGIRMTSITYCAESQKGAVLLIGAAPEQTAFRSSKLFEKVARSLRVRK